MQDAGAQGQQQPSVNVAALNIPPLHLPLGVELADWNDVHQQHSVATQIAVALVVSASALAIFWAKRLWQVAESAVRQPQPLQPVMNEATSDAPRHHTGLPAFLAACAALNMDSTPQAWRQLQQRQPRARRWIWQMDTTDRNEVLKDILALATLAGAVAKDFGLLWSYVFIPLRAYLVRRS